MTFLNPLILFGLVAAAIPLILHLLNLRKLRTVEFSTLIFLKELQQTKIRRIKLRQLLLLLVRTLIIVSIIIAFARPALRGTILGSIGTHANSSVVIILDDSFSMEGSDEHGKLFKQAKEVTGRILDILKEGDEVFLVKLSELPKATVDPATHDIDAMRTLVSESSTSAIRRPIDDALRVSARLLATSKNANKEVYVVSDFQRTLFPQHLSRQESGPQLFDNGVRFFYVNLGKKEFANASIDSVEVVTKILERDKPVSIFASVKNFSTSPLKNYVISLFLDGTRVAQGTVSAEPRGSGTITFTVIPKRSGFIKGYAELENDAIEADNRRFFTLNIPERINIMLIGNSAADIRFLSFAMENPSDTSAPSLLHLKQIPVQRFSSTDLKNTDVLLFSNVKSFSANEAERIKGFVEGGGGILLFPGPDMDIPNYNSTLLPLLHIPPVQSIISNPQGPLSFNRIDFDHPLFSTMFEPTQNPKQEHQQIESPHVITTLQRQAGKQARTIISLSDGSPFLTEHTVGEGKILFFSVAPLVTWSDAPVKGIFAPLMYRSAMYVSSHAETETNFLTGDEPIISTRNPLNTDPGQRFNLVAPDGTEELVRPSGQASSEQNFRAMLKFNINRLALQGVYELKKEPVTLSLFAANVDSRESDGTKITDTELDEFWKYLGIPLDAVRVIEANDQIQSAIMQSRFGVELWKYFVGLALFFALVEMVIARDSRKTSDQIQ